MLVDCTAAGASNIGDNCREEAYVKNRNSNSDSIGPHDR